MKELSLEEKAKAYDEAIEVAQRFYNNSVAITKKGLEDIFPELKESEDERIKKEIITYIKWCEDSGYCAKEEMIRWITFLEKQAEQKPNPCDGCINRKGCINCENGELRETEHKPTNKVEPKFKVGDRIKRIGIGYESWVITDIDEMFNEYQGKYEKGYPTSLSFIEQDNYELVEQKPAWSEEDENLFRCAIDAVKQESKVRTDGCLDEEVGGMVIDWLKSLKERVQPQQEWSEDDERYLNNTISYLKDATEFKETAKLCIDWLKSLRPQNTWKPSNEQMLAIDTSINVIGKGTLSGKQLIELQEQLKKLREE